MKERTIELFKNLIMKKNLEFIHDACFETYKIIVNKDNEILIEYQTYRYENPIYYTIDDIVFISFQTDILAIEIKRNKACEDSVVLVNFKCYYKDKYKSKYMKFLNPNGYYTGNGAKNKLIEMIKSGKKIKHDECMIPYFKWRSNSEVILVDDKLFLKFGTPIQDCEDEYKDGFFVAFIDEILIYNDTLYVSFWNLFSYIFKIV